MLTSKFNAGGYVGIVSTSSDECRVLVDQAVVQGTNVVVILITWLESGPRKLATELCYRGKGDLRLGHLFALDETEIEMRSRCYTQGSARAIFAEPLVKQGGW